MRSSAQLRRSIFTPLRNSGRCAPFTSKAGGRQDIDGARFEFRIFRPRLGPEAILLSAVAGAGQVDAGVHRYVLAPDRLAFGLKFRGGRAELKVLVGKTPLLEHWESRASVPLPASKRELAIVLRPLGLPCSRSTKVFPDVDAVARWLQLEHGLRLASIRKRRRFFLVPGARAELGEVQWAGIRLETLAVEGIDPVTVRALVARLGLSNATNTSYPRLISGASPPEPARYGGPRWNSFGAPERCPRGS